MKSRGFTLVELMIVIAILAILTTIGIVQYNGISAKARDSARKEDIYTITTTLEVNRNAEGYIALMQNQFSSFQWGDPRGNVYCIGVGDPSDPTNTSEWGSSCPSGYTAVAPGGPASSFLEWKVCTFLEASPNIFCRSSRQ